MVFFSTLLLSVLLTIALVPVLRSVAPRGRILTNMFQLKAYAFWDALTRRRTDGALVRLITPVYETERLSDAETRLQMFARDLVLVLDRFLPGKE